ncbi:MAG TPA: condensation domain-containing protein, partial [Pyrinomonadaceae bacterium]|nr:condensation domain-containing protein [Pyrinomonadaceae bacterium]
MNNNRIFSHGGALDAEVNELFELLLEEQGIDNLPSSQKIFPRQDPIKPPPLSFSQQGLWLFDRLEPNSCSYNMPTAIQLTGSLNVEALEQTLSEIIRRHEALRTTFTSHDGEPVQVIGPARAVHLHVTDLSRHEEAERQREVERLTQEEARRPFDLSVGPLLRVSLLRLGEQEHVVLLTMHHIISDGWSMGVLVKEVVTLYEAFAQKAASPLPELTIQYADYAVWQREYLQGEVYEEQLAYWKQQLAGVPPMLELPTDYPRPKVLSHRGAMVQIGLSTQVTSALKDLSRREGVTLFMTLLAAFQLLLARYTGQKDIMVGTPIANRKRAETEPLIGFFVNMLVLRANLTGDPTFSELLRQVSKVAHDAFAHQEMPFEKLVEELQPGRELNRHPLFEVTFALQNAPQAELTLPGLSWRTMGVDTQTSRFLLSLDLQEVGPEIWGALIYNSELFTEARMKQLLRHYERLLESIVAQPGERIGRLSLLSEEEVATAVGEWTQSHISYQEQNLHELFEAQVAQTPGAVAVVFGDEEVTYEELNERANQLAHRLRELGVGPEVLVGLMVERSVEMMVGLLGILKAGGAYLPLDPKYPGERLAFMLADSGVSVLLTQESLREAVAEPMAQVVCLDGEGARVLAEQGRDNPAVVVSGENVAYVIYTSGSSGQPKG